ncbi:hypothetical protein [Maliponia aquimaris]|uniref:Uncharacterized protein n=1 Tax=Maliponia aquimaris TaxID=1673631 RepID=A0A238KCV7_9RHOB|nr:hypothetical protein [Maliponia aquimaris]SMX40681.1 hypothetical protein MAA8898_02216 [Maliponia aquimaris]
MTLLPFLRFAALGASLALAAPALAEDAACRARIKAMFDGGPLDPFVRPPHRVTNTVLSPEGDMRYQYLAIWDSPARSIGGVLGSGTFALIVEGDSWTGPDPEGPWTAAPNMLPDDYDGLQRRQHAESRENLTDPACLGTVTVDDTAYEAVSYVTRTDPDPDSGAWFGARNTVYLDPETQRVQRWEMTDFTSSFAPELSRDIHVQVFSYDDPMTITRPE